MVTQRKPAAYSDSLLGVLAKKSIFILAWRKYFLVDGLDLAHLRL